MILKPQILNYYPVISFISNKYTVCPIQENNPFWERHLTIASPFAAEFKKKFSFITKNLKQIKLSSKIKKVKESSFL